MRIPTAKSVTPPRMPPHTTQGVRRPRRERVRSEKLPKTRLEIRETTAVIALIVPRRASGLSTPRSLRRWGRRTEAMMLRPSAHRTEMRRNPAPKRIMVLLGRGRPVSGARVEGAAASSAVGCADVGGMCVTYSSNGSVRQK